MAGLVTQALHLAPLCLLLTPERHAATHSRTEDDLHEHEQRAASEELSGGSLHPSPIPPPHTGMGLHLQVQLPLAYQQPTNRQIP
jgi:hypothetical protein